METYDDRTFKQKADRFVYDCKEKGKEFGRWILNNPDVIVGGIMLAGTVAGTVAKISNDARKVRRDFDESRRVWDPQMGTNLYSKRPMNGAEKLEFEGRVRNGEGRAEALKRMGLLDERR